MRIALVLLPVSLIATPALAQALPPPPLMQPPVAPPPMMQVPPQLADPAMIDRMGNAVEAVSEALLNMPVGEVRAAIKGREPTLADRRDTVARETGLSERDVHAKIEAAKPMIQHHARAMARALPRIMQSLAEVESSIDRAIANLPDPNYPRR